ncbi:glycosyltransferase [Sinomonas sp. JGH33]|uniref:Glycosyltransferase n=1 Tax=Sinomonas terricola TaxID=3110330 RepID=A0ABU5TBB1_9MICC|nr:glycosyltransferase [Sinomonas sp. JGH33]MEA5456982.1 glycosyltransferase [Sinomonas sp. JGH33]
MGHTDTSRRTKVAIVQPYVPTYRVAFFEGLRTSLAEHDIELAVLADVPDGAQSGRNDAAQLPWITPYRELRIPVAGHSLRLGTAYRSWKSCDAVVVGHLGSSIDTNLALALSALRGTKVGVWGHIGSYVGRANPLDSLVERWQLRRAGHVFAYTPGGARLAIESGADPSRVTAVMNTIDTAALEAAVAGTDDGAARELLGDVDPLKTFCFIGGLDASKRIGFLAEALDHVWAQDPAIKILVAGRGADEELLGRSVERGQTHLLGYADARVKAALGRLTRGILMPGRVGLIAVDALALGLPILSTAWPYHAPEAEYLTAGESLLESRDSPEAYAALVLAEAHLPARRELPRAYPRLDGMIANFSAGILSLLGR